MDVYLCYLFIVSGSPLLQNRKQKGLPITLTNVGMPATVLNGLISCCQTVFLLKICEGEGIQSDSTFKHDMGRLIRIETLSNMHHF